MREVLRLPPGRNGWVRLAEPHGRLHHWHHHEEPEFNLVLRGSARYLLADRRYDLGRHGLVWLFPRQEHLLVDMSPDFACWIGVMRPADLRQVIGSDSRYAGLLDPDPPGGFCRRLEASGAAFLDRLCHDLSEADSGAAIRFNAGLRYLLLAAWDRFSSAGALDSTALHPGLEQAVALLARQPSADISAVVSASGLSRWHLSRLFRSELGTTLTAWRSRVRVERALALHRQRPRAGWLELGLEAGFGSYAQFHRAFTSVTGVGPRRWLGTGDAAR